MQYSIISMYFLLSLSFLVFIGAESKPIGIRECWNLPQGTNADVYYANLRTFSTQINKKKDSTTVLKNMGHVQFQYTKNDTCVEILIENWSCDHDLGVTGPGLSKAIDGLSQQCQFQTGFGYYEDPDTGYNYTQHLWAIVRPCATNYIKSACSPGA